MNFCGRKYISLTSAPASLHSTNRLFNLTKAVSALSRGMGGGYQQGEGLGASNNTSLYVSSLPPGIDKPQV